MTMSSGWRQGPADVPPELLHRPPYLIKHVMAAELRSADITADMVRADADGRQFRVQSSKDRGKWHTLDLGDSCTAPSCSCRHFFRTRMPCKHFQAVFRHIPEVSFASLPVHYRDHPLFVVDEECYTSTDTSWQPATADMSGSYDVDEDATDDGQQQAADSSEAPRHARLARECRELAAVLVNYTFDVVQQDALLKVRQALNDAITVLGDACPTSGSLPVRAEASTSRDYKTEDVGGVTASVDDATSTPSHRQKTFVTSDPSARPSRRRRRAPATKQQAARTSRDVSRHSRREDVSGVTTSADDATSTPSHRQKTFVTSDPSARPSRKQRRAPETEQPAAATNIGNFLLTLHVYRQHEGLLIASTAPIAPNVDGESRRICGCRLDSKFPKGEDIRRIVHVITVNLCDHNTSTSHSDRQ